MKKKTIIGFLKIIVALLLFVGVAILLSLISERSSGIFKNVDWGIILQLLIFWALPGLLTILGILWLVGFLFKISRKLDD